MTGHTTLFCIYSCVSINLTAMGRTLRPEKDNGSVHYILSIHFEEMVESAYQRFKTDSFNQCLMNLKQSNDTLYV